MPLQHGVEHAKGSVCAENRLDLFSRFDTTPVCDGRLNRYKAVLAYTALRICVAWASRGKNRHYQVLSLISVL